MVHHLQRLGFESVYNRNEDFYAAIEAGHTPEHDVLVTNPPYSGEHKRRLLQTTRNMQASSMRGKMCGILRPVIS